MLRFIINAHSADGVPCFFVLGNEVEVSAQGVLFLHPLHLLDGGGDTGRKIGAFVRSLAQGQNPLGVLRLGWY